uniref:Uncharacterized protein n=1 Tax=Arundo donax TaxID=35708 RepID=A0A0A9HLR2_ARUDO
MLPYRNSILICIGRLHDLSLLHSSLVLTGMRTCSISAMTICTLGEGIKFIAKRWTILEEDFPQDIILGEQNL